MAYSDEYIYYDFIKSDLLTGTNKLNSRHFNSLMEDYVRTRRELERFNIETSVGAAFRGISVSVNTGYTSETEVSERFQRKTQVENERRHAWDGVLKEGQVHGTIVGYVDIQCAGITINKFPLEDDITEIWDKNKLEPFRNKNMTNRMRIIVHGVDASLVNDKKHKTVFIPPIKGKTCHHVQFLKVHNDNCTPDGRSCVELDGNEFVVCHHHNFNWIGGPGCNCTHVDNSNVMRKNKREFNPQYE